MDLEYLKHELLDQVWNLNATLLRPKSFSQVAELKVKPREKDKAEGGRCKHGQILEIGRLLLLAMSTADVDQSYPERERNSFYSTKRTDVFSPEPWWHSEGKTGIKEVPIDAYFLVVMRCRNSIAIRRKWLMGVLDLSG